MKVNNIGNMLAAGAIGFAIGGITTLVINTIQITKLKRHVPSYKCNINAVFEPDESKKQISYKKQVRSKK